MINIKNNGKNNSEYNIFSLNKFRKIKENSYNTENNCKKHILKWGTHISNPRFDLFDQVYFHAGDERDITKYGLLPLRYVYSKDYPDHSRLSSSKRTSSKRKLSSKYDIFKLYKNIDYISIRNTFDYMFKKFKKGIFIIIRDNKLLLFLPFSNNDYINNWYDKVYFTLEEKRLLESDGYNKIGYKLKQSIIDFQNKYPEQFGVGKRKINFDRKKWYANNCVFRNQFPEYEGELNNNAIKDMFESLLLERTIPDVEFFVNDRDFPILKKDYTEPYEHIFDSENVKIEKEFHFKKMAPIFSKSITDKYADLLMPTNDDWRLASGRFFTDGCSKEYSKNVIKDIYTNWDLKKPICIFRGSATGCGNTLENNMRLKAADISIDYPDLLDAGITDWKARPKKYIGQEIKIIDSKAFRFELSNFIDNKTKSGYKYILNIDGYVSAFRLSSEFRMNSVVLIVNSDYKLWFSHLLKPYVHYVPVLKDLSDLISQIKWCIDHDAECKKIAYNGLLFYEKYLSKNGIFNYLETNLKIIYKNKNLKNLLNVSLSKSVHDKPNIAVISCFRDKGNGVREKERKIFVQLMNQLLKPYFNFHIYIIEQSNDGEDFNIGKLKNIGFKIASTSGVKFDNYVFSDIDTIPDYNLLPYFCKSGDYPMVLAFRGTRYEVLDIKIHKPFLGALLGFSGNAFKDINGYPNNFWAWGGEDDAILNRLLNCNKKYLDVPKVGHIIDFEEVNMKPVKIVNKIGKESMEPLKFEKLFTDLSEWKNNGLSNLNYKELSRLEINDHTTQIVVDLMKKVDEIEYPQLFPEPSNNYKTMEYRVKMNYKRLKYRFV